jgi:hypothetical protein
MLTMRPRHAPHEGENLSSHFEHANEVDLDDLLAFASVDFIKGPIAAKISRIVDKDVDARRGTENSSKSPFDLIAFRNIDAHGLRTDEFHRMDIPNPDFGTGSYKLGCDRPAYSPSATGYDHRLAGKIEFWVHSHAIPELETYTAFTFSSIGIVARKHRLSRPAR